MIKSFRGVQPQIHPSAFVEESAQIIGDVQIGEESSVWFNAVLRGDVFLHTHRQSHKHTGWHSRSRH